MVKLTPYQLQTMKEISAGKVMLRGRFDQYFWEHSDKRCSHVARRLKSKGLIKTVYLNSIRDRVEITGAGHAALRQREAL